LDISLFKIKDMHKTVVRWYKSRSSPSTFHEPPTPNQSSW